MELKPAEFEDVKRLTIGVISDTHGLLRPEALHALDGADVILHGGDVGGEEVLDELGTVAPVYTVRGNVDYEIWCGRLPNVLSLRLGSLSIYMVHDISHLDPQNPPRADLLVYGHSHKPEVFRREEVTYLNPGSAGPRRFTLPITVAKLSWKSGQKNLSPELIHLLD
tara:strand:+ start:142 stop:642 length:501 start_codon:yes stop_codon:yes gene_type:complete